MNKQVATERAPDRLSLPQTQIVSKFGGDNFIEQDVKELARDIYNALYEQYLTRKAEVERVKKYNRVVFVGQDSGKRVEMFYPIKYTYANEFCYSKERALEIAKELINVHK